MKGIWIEISRDEVYEEVAKVTDYTGSKMIDSDEGARDRILATDEDLATLDRFRRESVSVFEDRFRDEIVGSRGADEEETDGRYKVQLRVARGFNRAVIGSLITAVKGFFTANIAAQWFRFTAKEEASDYFQIAEGMLAEAERLISARVRPRRPD